MAQLIESIDTQYTTSKFNSNGDLTTEDRINLATLCAVIYFDGHRAGLLRFYYDKKHRMTETNFSNE